MNYLVVDLEGTCCTDESIQPDERETIEIGAVLVSSDLMKTMGEFDIFIRPVVHPKLTQFCIDLTGIQQSYVDKADTFPIAFDKFCRWFVAFGDTLFCSWGKYDKQQFQRDCDRHGVRFPFAKHLDLAGFYKSKFGKKRGIRRAMKSLGIHPKGQQHRGIDDARNYATMLLALLRKEKE